MEAVQLDNTQNPQLFEDAYRQLPLTDTDWDQIFSSYNAVVDWPGAAFWEELLRRYSDAKCILTTRDPERWWQSIVKTLHPLPNTEDWDWPAKMRNTYKMWEVIVRDGDLQGIGMQKAEAIRLFKEHDEAVKSQVDASRLLVIDCDKIDDCTFPDLCRFLGHEVPDEASWPTENQGKDFKSRYGEIKQTLEKA